MKYDDAAWHYEGDYPADLPPQAAATHIGMYLAWLYLNDHCSEEAEDDFAEELQALRARQITGGEYLRSVCDEKLTDDDLDADGNAFTLAYYQGKDNDSKYYDDYAATFGTSLGGDLYTVADTWENYDKLAQKLDARYNDWLQQGRPECLQAL